MGSREDQNHGYVSSNPNHVEVDPNYVEVTPKVESFWGALGCPGVPWGALGVLQGTLGAAKGVFQRPPRGPWRAKIINCTHSRAV